MTKTAPVYENQPSDFLATKIFHKSCEKVGAREIFLSRKSSMKNLGLGENFLSQKGKIKS